MPSKLFQYKFSLKEQTLFAKRLSYLMRAGVPILDSLNLLKEQLKSKSARNMFGKIVADVANGQFLSSAMEKFRDSFSEFAINIIKVGETSGILSENLEYLAEELKKKQILKKKIVSALFYPIFIVVATLGMSGVLTVFVFPKVLPIFASVGAGLPVTTQILIAVSKFLIAYGVWVLLLLVAGVVGFGLLMRVPSFRFAVEKIIFRLPLAGKISQSYQLSNLCRTLGLLLKGESKLEHALLTTASTTGNLVYERELKMISAFVSRGGKISTYMDSRRRYFPDMISHMVAVGETTGNLSDTFIYLAEMYEQDLDDLTKNLSGLLEPVLMIFMGVLVGFVAVSIITPIYSVTQKLKP